MKVIEVFFRVLSQMMDDNDKVIRRGAKIGMIDFSIIPVHSSGPTTKNFKKIQIKTISK